MILVVMGVSGSGKTTIGKILAERLGYDFSDADAFHSAANKAKMASGVALTDEDRRGWLAAMARAMAAARAAGRGHVFTCSALKRAYRDCLRHGDRNAMFVYLRVPRALLEQRLATRTGHFFDPALLQDQLETLEEPGADEAMTIDATSGPDAIVETIIERLESSMKKAARDR